jgi:D-alanyl-D-alanine dipeptidase
MKKTSFLIFCLFAQIAQAQEGASLLIIDSPELLRLDISKNLSLSMSDLVQSIPSVKIDLKYASKLNFTGKRMYPSKISTTYLRSEATKALAGVAAELKTMDLGVLIWDAYRPYDVTVRFWKLIHDERYVANPQKGSGHNRGIAVDLSIYRISDGKELNMPTGFDDFSEKAHHGYMQLDEEQIKNRELLLNIMEKYGFRRFTTEWWHYSWPEAEKYTILNLTFKQLQ